MGAMQAEVFGASRAIDVPEGEALRAAAPLGRALVGEVDSTPAPRRAASTAMQAEVAALRVDMNALWGDVTGPKLGLTGVEGELAMPKWTMGFSLAFLAAITVRLFPL